MKTLGEVLQGCRSELESLASYQAWCAEHGLPLDRAVEERMEDYKEHIEWLLSLAPNLAQGMETPLFQKGDIGGPISYYRPIDDATMRPYLATVALYGPRLSVGHRDGKYYVEVFVGLGSDYYVPLTDIVPADLPTMVLVGEAEGHLVLVRAREVETYRLAAGEDGQQPSRS